MADRMTAFKWLGWELFELPPDAATAVSDEDNLLYAKALLVCASGDGEISQQERDWIVGYLTTAGDSEEVVETVRTYDGSDSLEDLFAAASSMALYGRGMIYDALRACSSDGELSAGERERIVDAAERVGLPTSLVDELEEIVRQEEGLRKRRHKLIVADAFAAAQG